MRLVQLYNAALNSALQGRFSKIAPFLHCSGVSCISNSNQFLQEPPSRILKAEGELNHPSGQEVVMYHSSSGMTNIVIILILPRKRNHSLQLLLVRASSKYVNGSPIAERAKSVVSFYLTPYLSKLYIYTYGYNIFSKPC